MSADRLRRELAIPLGNSEIAHLTVPSPMSPEEWRLLTSVLAAMRAGLVEEPPRTHAEVEVTSLLDPERRIMDVETGKVRTEPFVGEDPGWREVRPNELENPEVH